MSTPGATDQASVEQLLRLGDSALVHGQRLSEWCGHGPALEEDIALANIALDCVGEARLLLALAGAREGQGRDEDALAYLRDEAAFRNYTLLELPNGNGPHDDYAITVVRGFLHAALQVHLWPALAACADRELAAIAARSINEARAHLRHFGQWVVRLGDGTDLSHERMVSALERLFPYTNEFWSADPVEAALAAASRGVVVAHLKPAWDQTVNPVLNEAGLSRPADSRFVSTGKLGRHSEHLSPMLAEMQALARAHPGARW
jgi:ring-1,2-phenylacetyl-CoA epoxidase subunit PaaC